MSENLIWAHTETPEDESFITIAELRNQVDRAEVRFFENLQYWNYFPEQVILQHKTPLYDVCLKDLSSRSNYLDWILRIHGKQWMTQEAFVEFMTASRYLLSNKLRI